MEVQRNSCMYVERNNNLPGGLLRFSDGGVGNKGSATTTMMPFASKLDGNTLTHADHNGSGGCLSNASGSCVTSAGLLDSSSNLLLPPSSSSSSMSPHFLMLPLPPSHDGRNCYNMDDSNGSLKAKIMVHPHYPRLLTAYANCHKVGAPREVVSHLEDAAAQATTRVGGNKSCIGDDPALDQFMEAYCEMLTKYEQELTKPFKEAMIFINKMESQFKSLALSSSQSAHEGVGRDASSEDEADGDNDQIDPQAKERELKDQLLKRYSGYLGSLKQEFLKKRKKGKLPKEARQQLLDWWARHYKWPYPSESQKLALAESTGLDQKQINNWFINQRKRHWRPSEEMQLVVMDASHPHYYMDDMGAHTNFPMDCSPMLL